ncbi:MAG: oxygenase MpaB family protein [Ketobacter sp.]|nr:MAG: DUF2236 domain-containing protein [Ketobacter sp.]
MDGLVNWMFEADTGKRKAQIQQAIQCGPDRVKDCPQEIQVFFKTLQPAPTWIDFDLIEEGIRFTHSSGLAAGYVLRDLALMGGYLLSGFNQSLIMTGALNKGTSRRIAETGKWWIDCTEPHGLRPQGPGYQSTLNVRLVHSLVRRGLNKRADWDHSHWALPLSQIDMVATYLGFSVVMLVGLRKLGFPILPRESTAVIHLWSYACWLMGVEEQWLVKSEAEGFVLLNHTYMTQSKPDENSKELAEALSKEPLERTYPRFERAQRKLSYHLHLGMSRYFLGREKMQQLGFKDQGIPWLTLASNVPRPAIYCAGHFLPGMRPHQQRRGRKAQLAMLTAMFGDEDHGLIAPDRNHPAHIDTGN